VGLAKIPPSCGAKEKAYLALLSVGDGGRS
jgi:hypothetical protein